MIAEAESMHKYVLIILFVQRNIPVSLGNLKNEPGEKPFSLQQLQGVRGHVSCLVERIKPKGREKSPREVDPKQFSYPTQLFLVAQANKALIIRKSVQTAPHNQRPEEPTALPNNSTVDP